MHVPDGKLLTPHTIELEREIYEIRYALATAYASSNRLNRTTVDPSGAWIGIVSSGITYREVREALQRLGLASDDAVSAAGIRLLKMQMPLPFDPATMRRFARGLSELFVIEEKQPNLESLVKDALYNQGERPMVIGKLDERERPLLPGHGSLSADDILPALRSRLEPRLRDRLAPEPEPTPSSSAPLVRRTPFYCSGCPHNRSTRVPEGSLVAAGIGCHTMVMLMDERRVGDVSALACMGNEGTQWIGMSEFVERDHLFQNLGDGTYFHSGQLAVQAAVAAGVDITYKLLWNGSVAMTGGQAAEGSNSLAGVARVLLAQGVSRVLVTSVDPGSDDYLALPPEVEVWDRSRLLEAQKLLAGTPGVTVLVHDQACAAGARRARKRGLTPKPGQRVAINPRICEGCGDCGSVSNCLSVQPFATPFGRKTRIDQTTCNLDFSCLEGDCPAFMSISVPEGGGAPDDRPAGTPPEPPGPLTEPALAVGQNDFAARITGIGGTGVVTVSQVLGTAAARDGFEVRGLDQIGLSQKAGPVVSDLRLRRGGPAETNRLGRGQADLILAFDGLVAASAAGLPVAHPDRTTVVGSTSPTPTGAMIATPGIELPTADEIEERLAAATRDGYRHWADAAAVTTALIGDALTANLFVVGMAVQAGCLPIRAASIEWAIELNGVAVAENRAAFRWGRQQVADPQRVVDEVAARTGTAPSQGAPPLETALDDRVNDIARGDGELTDLLRLLTADLVGYQDRRLASDYLAFVAEAASGEATVAPGSMALTTAVARGLHKLLAYKDEYEVARLMLLEEGLAPARAVARDSGRIAWRLHPPLLRALGLSRKIAVGTWAAPAVRLLARAKWLRGSWLDPFARTRIRRIERELPDEYRAAIRRVLEHLKPELLADAVAIAKLPAGVRGYEDIKLASIHQFRARLAEELERFPAPVRGSRGLR